MSNLPAIVGVSSINSFEKLVVRKGFFKREKNKFSRFFISTNETKPGAVRLYYQNLDKAAKSGAEIGCR